MARISAVLSNVLKLSVLLASLTGEKPVAAQESRDRDSGAAPSAPGAGEAQSRYLPPGGQPSGTYKLGITPRNTDTGVQILQVAAGSVAQRS